MLTPTASFLKKLFAGAPWRKKPPAEAPADEDAPIYESLAMTDELRDALFPKHAQMVSAIFDRPAPLVRPPQALSPAPAQSQPAAGNAFPIIF